MASSGIFEAWDCWAKRRKTWAAVSAVTEKDYEAEVIVSWVGDEGKIRDGPLKYVFVYEAG